jgi:hypothetical protein
MIANKKTGGFLGKKPRILKIIQLVTDVYDPIPTTEEAYNVTTSKGAFPCARSVFIIKK